ncbi:MAG TPA: hypothetical protein VIK88_04090, partial [Candidatus Bathyarchaeia archaeon]
PTPGASSPKKSENNSCRSELSPLASQNPVDIPLFEGVFLDGVESGDFSRESAGLLARPFS